MEGRDDVLAELCGQLQRELQAGGTLDVSTLRLIRSNCATDKVVVIAASQVIQTLFERCKQIARHGYLSTVLDLAGEESAPAIDPVEVTIICQIFANFSANRNHYASTLFSAAGKQGFQDTIQAAKVSSKRNALAAVIAAIYNCVCEENSDSMDRLEQLVRNRSLCSHILLSVSTAESGAQKDSEDDPFVQWLHLLTCVIVQRGQSLTLLRTMAARVDSNGTATPWTNEVADDTTERDLSKLTHEQVRIISSSSFDLLFRICR